MLKLGLKQFGVVLAVILCSVSHAEPVRVLSLDGGGIRGMLEAYYLMQIEAAAKKPIHELFELIAGTSTGGIIALGLTIPDDSGKPRFTSEELYNLYATKGKTIFQETWHFYGLLREKFSAAGLEKELQSYFGESKLKDALTDVAVTSYSMTHESGVLFSSRNAKQNPAHYNYPVWQVARATSAAPTYFKPFFMDIPLGSGESNNLIDGGLYRNNPALLAYLEAREMFPGREIEVYSFGTGRAEKPIADEKSRGALSWIAPVLHHMFVAVSQGDSDALHRLLNDGAVKRYFRINTRLDSKHDALDDSSKENITYLASQARKVVRTKQFRSLVAQLLQRDVKKVLFPLRENGHDLVPTDAEDEDPFVLVPNNEASAL